MRSWPMNKERHQADEKEGLKESATVVFDQETILEFMIYYVQSCPVLLKMVLQSEVRSSQREKWAKAESHWPSANSTAHPDFTSSALPCHSNFPTRSMSLLSRLCHRAEIGSRLLKSGFSHVGHARPTLGNVSVKTSRALAASVRYASSQIENDSGLRPRRDRKIVCDRLSSGKTAY